MTNLSNLSAQIAVLGQHRPEDAQAMWSIALKRLDPATLRLINAVIDPGHPTGDAVRRDLTTLANERETTPFTLGPK